MGVNSFHNLLNKEGVLNFWVDGYREEGMALRDRRKSSYQDHGQIRGTKPRQRKQLEETSQTGSSLVHTHLKNGERNRFILLGFSYLGLIYTTLFS